MIKIRKPKNDFDRICNACGKRECKDIKEVCLSSNTSHWCVISLCEECQIELMEKLWEE